MQLTKDLLRCKKLYEILNRLVGFEVPCSQKLFPKVEASFFVLFVSLQPSCPPPLGQGFRRSCCVVLIFVFPSLE